ncbi:MAG: phenylalanine--tRNA ligase subunit beta [Candidatus Asgardarchaeia archaeon]
MPTITINYEDLVKLVGKKLSMNELEEIIMLLKGEVEEVVGEDITLEVTADRIDLLSTEGWARAIKGFLEIEMGIPEYDVLPPTVVLNVKDSVFKVRPYIVAAVIRDIKLNEDSLVQLMQFQEKLHTTWCRNRKKGSIGIYDSDKITPPIIYTALSPDKIRFVPLEETKEMTGREILEEHPKGIEFAHLLKGYSVYPILVDSKGTVLSMPPIINSNDTRVTADTKNLFIDVTGTSEKVINYALNALVTNIAERHGKIELVKINYPNQSFLSPNFEKKNMKVSLNYIRQITGLQLSDDDIIKNILKARLNAEKVNDDVIEVTIPSWRPDFLHPIDIAEEVAISFGYNKIEPELPNLFTIGKTHRVEDATDLIRDLMVGSGFQEVRNYIFTNKDVIFEKMLRPEKSVVEIENPVTTIYTVLRDTLLPGLLKFLSNNTHVPYPQRVFEVGDVVEIDEHAETKIRQYRHLAGVISDDEVSFEEIHSVFHQLMLQLGFNYILKGIVLPYFIKGRSAEIIVNNQSIGVIGEIHPRVLNNFSLENPSVAFEIDLTRLLNLSLY